jgi:hypothetical protein
MSTRIYDDYATFSNRCIVKRNKRKAHFKERAFRDIKALQRKLDYVNERAEARAWWTRMLSRKQFMKGIILITGEQTKNSLRSVQIYV